MLSAEFVGKRQQVLLLFGCRLACKISGFGSDWSTAEHRNEVISRSSWVIRMLRIDLPKLAFEGLERPDRLSDSRLSGGIFVGVVDEVMDWYGERRELNGGHG